MKQKTISSFFWEIIKPYKWWYVLMLQAPLIASFYPFIFNYSIKTIIDLASENQNKAQFIAPMLMLVSALIIMETAWRVGQYAFFRSQPFVRYKITLNAYDYLQRHSYYFFQNNSSGTLISKIKNIVDGYNNIMFMLYHRVSHLVIQAIVVTCVISIINVEVFLFMIVWAILFFTIMFRMSFKAKQRNYLTTEAKHKVMGLISDNITNIFTLFAFAKRDYEYEKIKNSMLNDQVKKDADTMKYEIKYNIIGAILYISMFVSVLCFMIHLLGQNSVTIGGFGFVMTMVFLLCNNIWALIGTTSEFFRNLGDFKSSFSFMQISHDSLDKKDAMELIL